MLIYTPEKESYWPPVLRDLLISSVIFSLPLVYDLLFPNDVIKDTWYLMVVILLLSRFVDLISRPRVNKVTIDEEKQTISLYYSSRMSGEGEKTWLLNKVQVEVKRSGSSVGTPLSLTFWKGLWHNLNISTKNDGFSAGDLQAISQQLQLLGAQVKEQK